MPGMHRDHSPYINRYTFFLPKKNYHLLENTAGIMYYFFHRHDFRYNYRKYLPNSYFLSGVSKNAHDVVSNALNLIGVRYIWGGNFPEHGLDCSGFVKYVIDHTCDVNLPRRAVEMSKLGKIINIVDLQAGDLVFFNTQHSLYSHVGIYIMDNIFVHAPSTGNRIRVDSMKNRYWAQRYTGARRLDVIEAQD